MHLKTCVSRPTRCGAEHSGAITTRTQKKAPDAAQPAANRQRVASAGASNLLAVRCELGSPYGLCPEAALAARLPACHAMLQQLPFRNGILLDQCKLQGARASLCPLHCTTRACLALAVAPASPCHAPSRAPARVVCDPCCSARPRVPPAQPTVRLSHTAPRLLLSVALQGSRQKREHQSGEGRCTDRQAGVPRTALTCPRKPHSAGAPAQAFRPASHATLLTCQHPNPCSSHQPHRARLPV